MRPSDVIPAFTDSLIERSENCRVRLPLADRELPNGVSAQRYKATDQPRELREDSFCGGLIVRSYRVSELPPKRVHNAHHLLRTTCWIVVGVKQRISVSSSQQRLRRTVSSVAQELLPFVFRPRRVLVPVRTPPSRTTWFRAIAA
jgi:hypothetical protein